MSHVSSRQILQWVTTPRKLRSIAAEMEERAKISMGGSDLTAYINSSEDGTLALHIVADGNWVNQFQRERGELSYKRKGLTSS